MIPLHGALALQLGRTDFTRIRAIVHDASGIDLRPGKEALVRGRLAKRLATLGLRDFGAYLERVERDPSGREVVEMLDALTTNKTGFFREPDHFDFLREHLAAVARESRQRARIRLWSAGCSSGEEPYSLAMIVREELDAGADARILATDISTRMVARARRGVYPAAAVAGIPAAALARHFTRLEPGRDEWQVHDRARALVRVARLNLVERWPMRGPFDAIFCRNVMIYFDEGTRQALIERFWELLAPGGHLFVGHSESLTALSHRFRYVRPAVYVK